MKTSTQSILAALPERHPALGSVMDSLRDALERLIATFDADGKLLVCGNGGSAADSEHIVGELVKGFRLKRPLAESDQARLQAAFGEDAALTRHFQRGLPALALTGHPSLATAIINDLDASLVYAQQVYVLGRSGDALLGISTSGNARNVLHALRVGRANGLTTLGLTGGKPCAMDAVCDCVIHVPETETYRVQELHLPVYHTLCMALEEEYFGA